MGKKLDIVFLNEVMAELGKYFEFKYVKPLYNKEYIQFELTKEHLNNPKPTVVTIKSNKRIILTVNRKPNIPNLAVTQTEYTKSEKYKGWTRISCGHNQIKMFLGQLSSVAKYL